MGDPKKLKKRYSTPSHPWIKAEIELNKELTKEYGLKKKKEVYIANSFLKKYKNIAKRLISDNTLQGKKEKEMVIGKLAKLGLVNSNAEFDDILSLELKDVLERRLQTLVHRNNLARTANQARQFITHRHIMVGDKEVTSPSYLVSKEEEAKLTFKDKSALADEEHPERFDPNKDIKAEVKEIKAEVKDIKAEKKADLEEDLEINEEVEEE
jgi:small subunit ribosomal protein S4